MWPVLQMMVSPHSPLKADDLF